MKIRKHLETFRWKLVWRLIGETPVVANTAVMFIRQHDPLPHPEFPLHYQYHPKNLKRKNAPIYVAKRKLIDLGSKASVPSDMYPRINSFSPYAQEIKEAMEKAGLMPGYGDNMDEVMATGATHKWTGVTVWGLPEPAEEAEVQ